MKIYYWMQCNAVMEITDRQWCDYICWTPDMVGIYRIHRDTDTFNKLLPYYKEFADAILTDVQELPRSNVDPKYRRRMFDLVYYAMDTSVDKTHWACASRDECPEDLFATFDAVGVSCDHPKV